MLEIIKTAISFDEEELIELERIIIDEDLNEALVFLRKSVIVSRIASPTASFIQVSIQNKWPSIFANPHPR